MTAAARYTHPTINKWLRIFSPCILAALLSLGGIFEGLLDMNSSEGWSILELVIFIPTLLAVLVIDLIVKLIFKKQLRYIWLTEIAAILGIYFIFLKGQ